MNNELLKIGITGNIGSGKSTFCDFLERKGYEVLRADDIAKGIINNDKDVKEKIISNFGKLCYSDGKLNTQYLAGKVFLNSDNVELINSIVHPKVLENLNEQIKNLSEENKYVFIEAALIYEANIEDYFDYTVLISAKLNLRFKRKEKSDNYNFKSFQEREENQITEEEKRKRVDFEFVNNSTLEELSGKADLLLILLNGLI